MYYLFNLKYYNFSQCMSLKPSLRHIRTDSKNAAAGPSLVAWLSS